MTDAGAGGRLVGLPRGLVSHLMPELWETFFETLGLGVRRSPPTGAWAVERAEVVSEPEHCLPVKLYDAHVEALAGKADTVFVPRMLSLAAGRISCPKLGALPDAIRAQFGDRLQVLSIDLDERRQPLAESMHALGVSLGAPPEAAGVAADAAAAAMAKARRRRAAAPGAERPYLVLGHPYNVHDPFLAGPVLQALERLGARAAFIDESAPMPAGGPVRWDTCTRLVDGVERLAPGACAGVVQISSFNCGCDSIVGPIVERLLRARRIPLLTLMLDGHAAAAGLETRIEAFVESVEAVR